MVLIMLNLVGRKSLSPSSRFALSFTPCPMSGCWLWLGSEYGSNRYGRIMVNGKSMAAHRYSWITHYGEISKGLFVLHKCDNPACVNPNHLFLGTHQDNSDDKVRKGRQAKGCSLSKAQNNQSRRGEKNHMSKLTDKQRELIISLNMSQRAIAKMFNVTQANIWRIKNDARIFK